MSLRHVPGSGIMQDPVLFPNPEEYIPERFVPGSALFNPALQPFDLPFGFGRRVCPGMHLARNSIFITISRILWAFDISPPVDENGAHILPDPNNFTLGFNSRPMPFGCVLKPRSEKIRELVMREGEAANESLAGWE